MAGSLWDSMAQKWCPFDRSGLGLVDSDYVIGLWDELESTLNAGRDYEPHSSKPSLRSEEKPLVQQ